MCGSVGVSAGSDVLNWNVLLCVGISKFCVGVWGGQQGVACWFEMYCYVLVGGYFLWDCEGVSRKWRTEFYVLLCVGCCTFCVGVWGVSCKWRTELYVLLCCLSDNLCGYVRGQKDWVYWNLFNSVCSQLDILCGSVRGSGGSNVMNWNILLGVGSWTLCVGLWGG